MPPIDFISALGQLLSDGALRDALAADPGAVAARLNLRESDRAALVQLVPADLEFQADILLRKRFGLVRRIIPETCRSLGAEAWPLFRAYARHHAVARESSGARDAHDFCLDLHQHRPAGLCQAERNRLHFAFSQSRFALHLIRRRPAPWQCPRALQFFLRLGRRRWREMTFYVRA
ncbi:MAG: hypothetical protein DVB27_12325 [Verrucomicrobia bacterium]|nr:MAG: hypothetical protein DVB27_12325 [Verrucomicrobiota bacterium]